MCKDNKKHKKNRVKIIKNIVNYVYFHSGYDIINICDV